MRSQKARRSGEETANANDVSGEQVPSALVAFFQLALHYEDAQQAEQLVAEQARLSFEAQHGGELEQLALDVEDLEARFVSSNDLLAQLEGRKRNAKEFVKRAEPREEAGSRGGGFLRWRRRDQLTFVMLAVAQLAALAMGMANVFANLLASGQVVFAERPWLALGLSAVVPAGACGLKFLPSVFEHATSRRRYAVTLYGLTAAGLVLWSVAFALNYAGLSSGIDWESLGENTARGTWLVWSQLVLEVLIAGALFLAADEIAAKYASDTLAPNPEFLNADRALRSHLAEHAALRGERGEKRARHTALVAQRQSFVNEQVAAYVALRSRVSFRKTL